MRVTKQLFEAFAQQIEDGFRVRSGAPQNETEVTEEQIREAELGCGNFDDRAR